MIGIKSSDDEIAIRIFNNQRLPDLNTNKHRFIKLQKQKKKEKNQLEKPTAQTISCNQLNYSERKIKYFKRSNRKLHAPEDRIGE